MNFYFSRYGDRLCLFYIFSIYVLKLFDSSAKALSHIWKSFLTAVKNMKSKGFYAMR